MFCTFIDMPVDRNTGVVGDTLPMNSALRAKFVTRLPNVVFITRFIDQDISQVFRFAVHFVVDPEHMT